MMDGEAWIQKPGFGWLFVFQKLQGKAVLQTFIGANQDKEIFRVLNWSQIARNLVVFTFM